MERSKPMIEIVLTTSEVITLQAALQAYRANRLHEAGLAAEDEGPNGPSENFFWRQIEKADNLYDKIENACCERV
jgi:hypothetical protein